MKGATGLVVVPPSVRLSGPHSGKTYHFVAGSLDDLKELPAIARGSLRPEPSNAEVPSESGKVLPGTRNKRLFCACRAKAFQVNSFEEMADFARSWNRQNNISPLPDEEVRKTASSAWKMRQEDRLWPTGSEAVVPLTASVAKSFIKNPDALCLLVQLRLAHGVEPEKIFAVSPKGIAKAWPWTAARLRAARDDLIGRGALALAQRGGKGARDPHLYRLVDQL